MAPHISIATIHPGTQLNLPTVNRRWSLLPDSAPNLLLQGRSESIGDSTAENGVDSDYHTEDTQQNEFQPPSQHFLAKPSALQHFQRQHQLHSFHSSSCTSLPNTPPQSLSIQVNPFIGLNNGGGQRERSQTLTQQQYQPTERAFHQRLGGVTESKSGFFVPVTTKDINDSASLAAGTMSAIPQQQMTPIQNVFSFQDPKIILSQQQQSTLNATTSPSSTAAQRRRLPQVPSSTQLIPSSSSNEPINQTHQSSQLGTNSLQQTTPQVRRTSSSRMLPTPPPPVSPTMNAFSQSPSPTFCLEDPRNGTIRRPSSTGRKLPPEPTIALAAVPSATLPPPAPNHLQRSASARTTASTANK